MKNNYWSLTADKAHESVRCGPDNERRLGLRHHIYMNVAPNLRKCLQVGVPSDSNKKYGKNFTAIDLYDQRDVIDYRCSLDDTPFDDSTFDLIICDAVLEHVLNPFKCSSEITRILKPNGIVWIEVPFIQPFHPYKGYSNSDGLCIGKTNKAFSADENHGGDYWRFTPQGICALMHPLVPIEVLLINDGGIAYYGRKEI